MATVLTSPKTGYSVSEARIVRALSRSYYEFMRIFWGTVVPEDPVWNWHISYICGQIQRSAERVFAGLPCEENLLCNISPGTTKSCAFSIFSLPWIWTQMPSARMIGGSHTDSLVLELALKSRRIVESDLYQAAFPEIKPRPDQWTKSHWENTLGGARYTATVGGKSPMGKHAHFLVVDDPIDPEQALTELGIKTANRWMSQTLPTRKVNKDVSVTWLVMQRLHQNDPAAQMLKLTKTKTFHICLPARKAPNIRPRKLMRMYRDDLMDPTRLSGGVLERALEDLGQYGFAGQYGQNPIPAGGGMFKTDQLLILAPPAPHTFSRIVRYWDKAATTDGGAYTVGVLLGMEAPKVVGGQSKRYGQFWVLHVERGQWDSHIREQIIQRTAEMDRITWGNKVDIGMEEEGGSSGKDSIRDSVGELAGYIVQPERPSGDKVWRADPFSVQVNIGNVRLAPGPWNSEYVTELKYFPNSTYKDQVDASGGAFRHITQRRIVGLK